MCAEMQNSKPKVSNYDLMRDLMEIEFSKYDHNKIIRRFSLENDEEYIFVRFVGRDYRINKETGRVDRFSEDKESYIHADYNESMTIFDMLTYSDDNCHLDGSFVTPNDFKGVVKSATGNVDLFFGKAEIFENRCEELKKACLKLGGELGHIGDVSSTIPLFDWFPVVVQFWDSDDEFDAVLKFMWDKNAVDFIHYETIAFATNHLIKRLEEEME